MTDNNTTSEETRTDRLSSAADEPFMHTSLVGSFFHNFEADGKFKNQGCVVAEVVEGVYLCELFSWMMGESTTQKLFKLEDMTEWNFYDTAEWMNNHYESHKGRDE